MAERDPVEMQQVIGVEFLRTAPREGWERGVITFRQVGKTYEARVEALSADGEYVGGRPTLAMTTAFRELRRAFAQPGKGTWLTAVATITPDGHVSIDLDYDGEPQWRTPTALGHYLEEWEQHPRSPEHTPAWLAERLDQARAEQRGMVPEVRGSGQ